MYVIIRKEDKVIMGIYDNSDDALTMLEDLNRDGESKYAMYAGVPYLDPTRLMRALHNA